MKLNNKKCIIFFLAIVFLEPFVLFAHGVMGKIGKGGIVVTAEYDTGEPMSYARVKILAPSAKLPFQTGRTDKNGCFCFSPDKHGEWKVVVDDEMGHRLEIIVPVDKDMEFISNRETVGPMNTPMSKYERVITGVSIIFGLAGIVFWWRARKGSGQREQ